MKKLFSTVLCAACLMLATPLLAVELTGLVTVQRGTTHGGCDNYMDTLDVWYEEAIFALSSAQEAVDNHYVHDTPMGRKVREAMFQWFKVKKVWSEGVELDEDDPPMKVRDLFSQVLSWFLQDPDLGIDIDKDETFLFCGSDFLVARQGTDAAQDYQGSDIVSDGHDITMNDVPGYASEIEEGNIAWWSGDHSPVKGYWFAPANSGANHCSDGNRELGFTGVLKALKQEVPGEGKPTEHQVQMIIICPYAFTHKAPETFQAAEAKLEEGVGIHQAVPRSATFLHEAFHVLHGSNFLQGEDEIYGEAKCLALGRGSPVKSKKNPENFVYFTTAMHYLADDNELPRKWDFVENPRRGRLFNPQE